ncbi:MAG: poly(R)-hydroxyalkanoic acid synthase subunit PhaC [Myxococcales bacterium]|nr:poly(R)-hydroxyalkanoic acid synthase subunit PhaC [Myxococcales bacterium]
MQSHNEWRDIGLKLADAFDEMVAHGARARLHAQAAFARLMHGKEPIEYVRGPATPHHLIHEGPLARLLHYPSARAGGSAKPILLVASLINKYYVMDLLSDLSVIALLNRRGFDVYVLDWKAPGAAGPSLAFTDYVDGVIPAAARMVGGKHGGALPAVIGYCMGGTLSVMFAARHPDKLRALCLLGTPVEFGLSGALAKLTDRRSFDADLLMDVLGNMPPAMMQSGFKMLNPADAFNKLISLMRDAADGERVRHFVALESWLDDNVAFPGGVYRDYIRALYQDDKLCKRTMTIGGTAVDLAKLTVPLLNVIALRDHICAPPASRALMPLVGSKVAEIMEFDTGHIGLTASRRSLAELWPRIADWMELRT